MIYSGWLGFPMELKVGGGRVLEAVFILGIH